MEPAAPEPRDPSPAVAAPRDEDYRLLVEAVEDYAIFMLDPQGRVASWNAGAQKIKGYSRDEIVGHHFSTFYTPEAVRAGWPDEELRLARLNGRLEDESWRVRKDGTRFWANVVITTLYTPSGELRGFAKVTRDLTERRRHEQNLQESEERFRSLVHGVKDYAIFMLDPQGQVKSWNTGGEAIHGYAAADVIGRHFSMFNTAADVRVGKPMQELSTALRDGRVETEGWRVRRNGATFWAHVTITPVYSVGGELGGFANVVRDLTEQKRLAEVESSSMRMKEFLAMLAHELRNPLAPMRNAVSIMQLQQLEHPSLQTCRDVIDRQLTHLTRLVDDLLDIGRISTGKVLLKKTPQSLREIVSLSIEAVRPLVEDRQHTLNVVLPDAAIQVLADRTRLVQALQNLLTNAAKYTDHGGHIGVKVRTEGAQVITEISDNGRGVAPEALERIFNLFVQEGSSTLAGESGLGIGLTLARSLVDMHGGSLSAASEGLGKGMTFTLRLPMVVQEPATGGDTVPGALTAGPTYRIMVIEDNHDAADSLVATLELMGHDARAVYDGVLALHDALSFQPQVVFLDLNMPRLNGFKVLQRLRDLPSLRSAYVIAMTGYGRKDDIQRSLDAGFDAHLTKPASMEQIRKAIGQAGLHSTAGMT
jgi:PAS domain S-box-containing protein